MPSVNIYTIEKNTLALESILSELKEFVAKKLSCQDRILKGHEISIRIIVPAAQSSIAETEIIIAAHSYPERVQNQDNICLAIKHFLVSHFPSLKSVYVWLQLSELGHSE